MRMKRMQRPMQRRPSWPVPQMRPQRLAASSLDKQLCHLLRSRLELQPLLRTQQKLQSPLTRQQCFPMASQPTRLWLRPLWQSRYVNFEVDCNG